MAITRKAPIRKSEIVRLYGGPAGGREMEVSEDCDQIIIPVTHAALLLAGIRTKLRPQDWYSCLYRRHISGVFAFNGIQR